MIDSIPEWLIALPFALSLVLFGMPHGAADGALALRWARGGWAQAGHGTRQRARPVPRLLALFIAYTVIIILAAIGLIAAPALGLLLFLMLSAAHFGLAASRLYAWDDPRTGIATGAAVVCLPFAIHHDATRQVFTTAATMLGGSEFPATHATIAGAIGVLAATLAITLHAFHFVKPSLPREASPNRRSHPATGITVVLAIVLTHTLLPPLMSVGVCFLAWHAVPETIRIGRTLGPPHGSWRAIARTHVASLALLVPTLLAIGALILAMKLPPSLTTIAVATIVAYAVLTPGHFAFQEWLHHRQAAPPHEA